MNVALWVIAGLLAAGFLVAGLFKVSQPKEKLATGGMGWTESYSAPAVKAIGAVEILAAIGLILPPALDIAPILAPLAASGLVIIMIGAIITHARRKENQPLPVNVLLLVLAAFVAVCRFGPYSF